ncbi:flagellar biosynthesis regulator FlaF [Aquisalinus flavus]|uniref:Flagellar biosynthesis regulatory protein FlaF n=1 Tax=Aquisalinus flavus TaxID=1526572 RepID=A0A8J2V6E7_9PROT|nr:flagellar biosynthesis regulator FlaF [Aquisalinus flavus]MBD0425916.1 flagellar biosynthesis regulator FlaF [Aquisalinus flavus]UNE48490.1 flagellar biosynthesis regulator FlaF [Aquisalinus flavus]GGD12232.1 flagellar biosynthesis regulatory protein FlaF [Aquisalinus flavus]
MFNSGLAAKAYATSNRETASGKQIELKVFSSITARIAAADTDTIGGFADLAEAMHENVRLWNIIAVDVVDSDNQLSQELRGMLLQLADFTSRHTMKVLRGEASRDVLVDINRAMIGGLSGIVPDAEEAA